MLFRSVAVGVVLGWSGFARLVGDLVSQGTRDRRAAARASREVLVRTEVALARRRWRTAGLTPSLALLEGLADARLDPGDLAVRERCAQEEAYLRQLIGLSPDSYRMSVWFARALAESRRRQVRLQVRSGETDALDEVEAAALGGVVVGAVAAARPGTEVVAGLYPAAAARSLVLVGDAGTLAGAAHDVDPRLGPCRYTSLADQDVLEISLAGGDSALVR